MDEESQKDLLSKLGLTESEVNKRLVGKKKEDEFLLFLMLLDVCESIIPIDESITQILGESSCDFIIQMKNSNEMFMLEVKHTDEEEYKISMGNLEKRIKYANDKNYKLYFAISIKGFWMVFDQDYIKNNNGKIGVKDGIHSELDTLFSTCSYLFLGSIKIRTIYSKKNHKKQTFIYHKDYGHLIAYEFYFNDKLVFNIKGKNSKYLPYTTILEALQDRISCSNQEIKKDKDGITVIEEFDNNPNMITEYTFLLSIINHITYDDNNTYDAHLLIKESKLSKSYLINKDLILILRAVIYHLAVEKGLAITYQIKDKGYYFPKIETE